MKIRFVHLSREDYDAGLASGNLPDIVATDNNLATILENGVALNADPYLEEYVPNFLTGETRLVYDVFKQLLSDEDGFYFFPQKIGYNGVGYSNDPYNRGYIVRWDYYKELGYPPINSEDDYLNVLMEMHARHPFTEEGYPTYLYGATNFQGYSTAFRSEISLDYWAAYKYQNNIFTNEILDGYTDTEHSMFWTGIEWYNRLYRAGKENGSFDMEIFTQAAEQYALHPDGYPLDFATISREYEIAAMTNNISLDICEHYGVELPSDACYKEGSLDFRNDCGEAITSCMSNLNRDQLRILSETDALLNDVYVDLCLAETDEEFNTIRDDTVSRLIMMGEPEVFTAYRQMWDTAADLIVPLVRQVQISNGIEPYTPEQYADHGAGTEVMLRPCIWRSTGPVWL